MCSSVCVCASKLMVSHEKIWIFLCFFHHHHISTIKTCFDWLWEQPQKIGVLLGKIIESTYERTCINSLLPCDTKYRIWTKSNILMCVVVLLSLRYGLRCVFLLCYKLHVVRRRNQNFSRDVWLFVEELSWENDKFIEFFIIYIVFESKSKNPWF